MPALVADIFYHVGAAPKGQEARLEEIVSRQWNLLSSSGLLARSRVHLGIVGDARSPTLAMMLNDSRVVVAARTAVGYECVTMSPLWYHARSVAHLPHAHQAPVLYLHSKGVGRAGRLRANVDDWTRAMEFFLVEQWRDALATMDREGTETAGIEMCGTLPGPCTDTPPYRQRCGSTGGLTRIGCLARQIRPGTTPETFGGRGPPTSLHCPTLSVSRGEAPSGTNAARTGRASPSPRLPLPLAESAPSPRPRLSAGVAQFSARAAQRIALDRGGRGHTRRLLPVHRRRPPPRLQSSAAPER